MRDCRLPGNSAGEDMRILMGVAEADAMNTWYYRGG